jgi:hypothetical protein
MDRVSDLSLYPLSLLFFKNRSLKNMQPNRNLKSSRTDFPEIRKYPESETPRDKVAQNDTIYIIKERIF